MAIQQNFPNIKPSLLLDFANVEALDPRITFTRASTATYYDGKTVALAEQNLLLYSQEFNNSYWTKTGITVTADQTTAPDGTTTADLIYPTTSSGLIYRNGAPTNAVGNTVSVYVKAAGFSWVAFGTNTLDSARVYFNLSTGAVGSVGSSLTNASIVSVGDGWYRLAFTVGTYNGASSCAVWAVDGDAPFSVTPNGTNGLYIWGAQLEQRSSVTAYTATTTQPITNYVPQLLTAAADVPRFEHNPVTGESLGLELEQARTNFLTYSEEFDNAVWAKTRSSVTANIVIAPDGTLTADQIIANTDNDTHFVTQTFTGTAQTHTVSVFAKANGLNHIALRLFDGTSEVGLAYYDLSTGAVGTVSSGTASITAVGNGWYRCILAALLTTSPSCTASVFLASADNTNSFVGDGLAGVTVWGAQDETANNNPTFATAYIQTVASQVTRAVDAGVMTGTNFSSWYTGGKGTLYFEALAQQRYLPNNSMVRVNDGTTNNQVAVNNGSPSSSLRASIVVSGTTYMDNQVTNQIVSGQFGKYALAFETNNGVLSANGVLGTVDTAVAIPSSVDRFTIAPPQSSGCYKKIAYYPLRLTNTELQALTS